LAGHAAGGSGVGYIERRRALLSWPGACRLVDHLALRVQARGQRRQVV